VTTKSTAESRGTRYLPDLLLGILPLLLAVQLLGWLSFFQDALVGNDERALPFVRPAYQALLFLPFSLLPYRNAYLAFLVVNLVLLALAFRLIRPHMKNLARIWRGLPVFVLLIFYPIALAPCKDRIRFSCCCLRLLWWRSTMVSK